jgi:hypothetical protein
MVVNFEAALCQYFTMPHCNAPSNCQSAHVIKAGLSGSWLAGNHACLLLAAVTAQQPAQLV